MTDTKAQNLETLLRWRQETGTPVKGDLSDDFDPGCTGKKRHPTEHAALTAIKIIGDHGMDAYHCRACNGWHSGHPPRKRRKIKYRR